jgi:membrane protease YdiL (CAAX protease family)
MNGRAETPTWGAGAVFAGVLVAALALIVGVGVVSIWDPELESTAGKIAGQSIVEISVIVVALWFARAGSAGATLDALGFRRFARSALKTAALVYGLYFLVAIAWGLLTSPEQEEIARELGGGEGVLATVLAGVMIVVLAPLGEEIFIRGFMFGGMRASWGFWPAAIVSGAFFGLLHYTGPESWAVVGQLAFFGAALAWLYQRTGSLWPPIIVHAVNNSLAFTIQLTG